MKIHNRVFFLATGGGRGEVKVFTSLRIRKTISSRNPHHSTRVLNCLRRVWTRKLGLGNTQKIVAPDRTHIQAYEQASTKCRWPQPTAVPAFMKATRLRPQGLFTPGWTMSIVWKLVIVVVMFHICCQTSWIMLQPGFTQPMICFFFHAQPGQFRPGRVWHGLTNNDIVRIIRNAHTNTVRSLKYKPQSGGRLIRRHTRWGSYEKLADV